MRQLTSYVLRRALGQLAHWNESNPDLSIAVNLAMPNLLDLRLPDEVSLLLDEAGVVPARLILEITENIVMADTDPHSRCRLALTRARRGTVSR